MHVGRIMRKDLVTVTPDTSLVKAKDIIAEKLIEHLLVIDKGDKLVGIVSDRDIKQAWASPATALSAHELNYLLKQLTVETIMAKKIITINPGTTIERAGHIMQENRISSLPVMENEKLVGIITTTDVMDVLLEAIGIDGESTRFVVLVEDRIGMIAEVSRILKEEQINIRSLVTWPEKQYPGIYHFVLRVGAANGERAISALTKAGFKVLTEYVEDLSPYLPSR
ncbi:MAG: CBS domain-containing protein [Deltaproteobacteria bacterium]|nr:CBS domain-containing protein [Deltaproteobacteria bacterium]MBW2074902.1 CBS domain-containing protein [Deltaproteobacteria bacterium]